MTNQTHDIFMQRAIDLACLAKANVRTNPNVGAVLVYDNKIIGEGFYESYGGKHAEVNAVESVSDKHQHLICDSTLYVTLEPCNFYGKTPPCSDFIIRHKIKKLIVGCEDPNPKIAGTSLNFLEKRGVSVTKHILRKECEALIRAFRVNILENRPYISIKYAQSKDFYLSNKGEQTWLSNKYSKVFSHKLRSENNAIFIGTETAIIDNPKLDNRLYTGTSPLRIVLDRNNRIPDSSHLLQDDQATLIISEKERPINKLTKEQWVIGFNDHLLDTLLESLYKEKGIGKMIVEGGAITISSFLKSEFWDEAFIINTPAILKEGIKAPNILGRLRFTDILADNIVQNLRRLA